MKYRNHRWCHTRRRGYAVQGGGLTSSSVTTVVNEGFPVFEKERYRFSWERFNSCANRGIPSE
jgi:hypothetical protein